MKGRSTAIVELGHALRIASYSFTAVTPSTHARVLQRARNATDLRDVFGWNRPFSADILPPGLFHLAQRAEVLERAPEGWRANVRFASLGQSLFLHGAYPTTNTDSVFFGPDSYRFCAFIRRELRACRRVVDIGCGSGVGGLSAADRAERVVLTDINESALEAARINVALESAVSKTVRAEVLWSDVLSAVDGPVDAVLANPPYMRDEAGRTYRDGGGSWGEGLAVRIAREALERLEPGGQLLLYTGAAVVDGVDVFRRQVEPICRGAGATFDYEELDPDVFGEELERTAYASVDRIAAVGLRAVKPAR
jgi:methylase of polypeptide subunit release factors